MKYLSNISYLMIDKNNHTMDLVISVFSTGFTNILKRKSLHFLTNWSTLPWLDKIGQQATFLLAQLRFCPVTSEYLWLAGTVHQIRLMNLTILLKSMVQVLLEIQSRKEEKYTDKFLTPNLHYTTPTHRHTPSLTYLAKK